MLEFFKFIFSDFYYFAGFIILIAVIGEYIISPICKAIERRSKNDKCKNN